MRNDRRGCLEDKCSLFRRHLLQHFFHFQAKLVSHFYPTFTKTSKRFFVKISLEKKSKQTNVTGFVINNL